MWNSLTSPILFNATVPSSSRTPISSLNAVFLPKVPTDDFTELPVLMLDIFPV